MASDDSGKNAPKTWLDRFREKVSLEKITDRLLESGYRKINLRSLEDGKDVKLGTVKIKSDCRSTKEVDLLLKSMIQYLDPHYPPRPIGPSSSTEFQVPSKSDKEGEKKFVNVKLSSKYLSLDELKKLADHTIKSYDAKKELVEQPLPEHTRGEDLPPPYSERSYSSALSTDTKSNDQKQTPQQQQTPPQQQALQRSNSTSKLPPKELRQQRRKSIGRGGR